MKYPSELYVSSSRPYRGIGDLEYPFHDRTITVTSVESVRMTLKRLTGSVGNVSIESWELQPETVARRRLPSIFTLQGKPWNVRQQPPAVNRPASARGAS
jgi:hypothetical protein